MLKDNIELMMGYKVSMEKQGFGKDNEVLDEDFEPQTVGDVQCREELGGISRVGLGSCLPSPL